MLYIPTINRRYIEVHMFEQHFQILDSDVFVSTMVLVVWETVSYFHLGIIELLM